MNQNEFNEDEELNQLRLQALNAKRNTDLSQAAYDQKKLKSKLLTATKNYCIKPNVILLK